MFLCYIFLTCFAMLDRHLIVSYTLKFKFIYLTALLALLLLLLLLPPQIMFLPQVYLLVSLSAARAGLLNKLLMNSHKNFGLGQNNQLDFFKLYLIS